MSVEAPIPPPATADQGALPSELTPESAVDSAAPAPISSTTRGSAAELISEHLSLLARTGNGLSYAYTRLEIHNKPLSNLDLLEAFPHLRYIDVSENQISDIRGLGHLEYILSLDAHGNNITTVPASIDKRKYIQHANFARNRIESWNVARWPMLSWLNLNGSHIPSFQSIN